MSFDRQALPVPESYFENTGLILQGRGTWRTTTCYFHGGRTTMRVNLKSGAWVCMSCGQKGGDVLAYEMKATGADFVHAARALGAWTDDDRTPAPATPKAFSARDALSVLASEANLAAVAASNVAHGTQLTPDDLARLQTAAQRINLILETYP
jgi:CHC2 zinc finger